MVPTLSIEIPAGVAGRVADAFIGQYPPPEGVPVGTAAEKTEYVRRLLIDHIRGIVRVYEASVAARTAEETAETEVNPT